MSSCECAYPDEEGAPEIKIVTGAYQIGKTPNSCEDAFFVSERAFGVADGVSGWNDYGFSSSMFSTQLMDNCRTEIETLIREESQNQQRKLQVSKKMRRSYMSMENLLLEEGNANEEEEEQEQEGEQSTKSRSKLQIEPA